MEKRIGVLAILVENRDSIPKLNALFTEFNDIVLGRQGLPIKEKNIQIISLIVEGSTDEIGALSGKIGRLAGLQVKSVLTKFRENQDDQNEVFS